MFGHALKFRSIQCLDHISGNRLHHGYRNRVSELLIRLRVRHGYHERIGKPLHPGTLPRGQPPNSFTIQMKVRLQPAPADRQRVTGRRRVRYPAAESITEPSVFDFSV